MNKRDFLQLVESVKEMKKIQNGVCKSAKITKFNAISIKSIRHKLHQSQAEFAFMIGVSPSTLKNWEQGVRHPEGPARALLKVAQKNPKAVYEALHGEQFWGRPVGKEVW